MAVFLVIILVTSCILFVVYTRRQKLKHLKETEQNMIYLNDGNMYDNIELSLEDKNDGSFEIYEQIDDERANNVYTEPRDYSYSQQYNKDVDDTYLRMSDYNTAKPQQQQQQMLYSNEPVLVRSKPPQQIRHNSQSKKGEPVKEEPSYMELFAWLIRWTWLREQIEKIILF